MTNTPILPLTEGQLARAAALTLAVDMTDGKPYDTAAVLDLADYIVDAAGCPLADQMASYAPFGPFESDITFEMTEISEDTLRLLLGVPEPEVYTVAPTAEAFASLPVGTVVLYPGAAQYIKVAPNHWVNLDNSSLLNAYNRLQDDHMATGAGVVVTFSPVEL